MDGNSRIYFDYAATTPVDPRVVQAMLPYFTEIFGNPSSVHAYGQKAETALDDARREVAKHINAQPNEIFFTGCGTESDNLALTGAAFAARRERGANRVVISPVEHHAISHTADVLRTVHGFDLETLPVNPYGQVDPEDVAAVVDENTAVVSVVYANNEIGSINPVARIGQICRARGVAFHTDAVQAVAHLPVDVQKDQVDLLSIGAHKFYGPKGVGVLYVRKGTRVMPVQTGGKQEEGLRAGTQNIPYIIGLAEALRLTREEMVERNKKLTTLRDRLIDGVLSAIPRSRLTGHPVERLPNHASFVFEGVDGNTLLMMLDMAGFACSSGSACKVGAPEPSDILLAVGWSKSWAMGSLRVTLGRDSNEADVERFLHELPVIIQRLRES